jgi:hypothetical protein
VGKCGRAREAYAGAIKFLMDNLGSRPWARAR